MPLIRWLNRHPIVFPLCLLALLAGLLASVLLDARPGLLLCGGLLALWAALRFYYGSPQSLCLSQELAEENRRARNTRDPEPLVTLCRELGEARRRPDPELRQTLAAALSLLGRTEEAERELAALLPRYARVSARRKLDSWERPTLPSLRYARVSARRKLPLAYTAVIVHCSAGNWAAARPFLEDLEKCVAQLPRGRGWRTWQRGLASLRLAFRLGTEGGSEELLSAYRQQLTGCKDLYDQVTIHMNLARCLLDLGRGDEAQPHLTFVAENGGKLAIRAEASARLAALSPAEN